MWLNRFFRLFRSEPTWPPVPLAEDGWCVFEAACRAARRGGREYVGTEHLLAGVADAGPTPALEALEQAGISPADVRRACASPPGLGDVPGPLPLTPAARRVFAAAWEEARGVGDEGVGSLGLLTALARDETGVARDALASLLAPGTVRRRRA